jgi:hypothetical protein
MGLALIMRAGSCTGVMLSFIRLSVLNWTEVTERYVTPVFANMANCWVGLSLDNLTVIFMVWENIIVL